MARGCPRRGFRPLLLALVTAGLSACGGGSTPEGETFNFFTFASGCGAPEQRAFVERAVREQYLYQDDLPDTASLASLETPAQVLEALTARARVAGRDRRFSTLTTVTADTGFLGAGEFIGFGVTFRRAADAASLTIVDVLERSPASAAGLVRGSVVLAIGSSASGLTPVAELLATQDGLEQALGPSAPGVTRTFRVRSPQAIESTVELTKGIFDFAAVPTVRTYLRQGLTPIGYIELRAFLLSSQAPLREAIAGFARQNIQDIIIDLRYNGGGAIEVTETLANLLGQARAPTEVMFRTQYHPRQAARSRTVLFAPTPDSIPATRIAFITTELTASASELLISTLDPYASVALIGAQTLGKPVGNLAIDMPGCDVRLRLVAYDTFNRANEGGYFQGLPDAQFRGATCRQPDDLTRRPGDPAERLTGEAIQWLTTNQCSPAAPVSEAGKPTLLLGETVPYL